VSSHPSFQDASTNHSVQFPVSAFHVDHRRRSHPVNDRLLDISTGNGYIGADHPVLLYTTLRSQNVLANLFVHS
jgi:hypothetical protein